MYCNYNVELALSRKTFLGQVNSDSFDESDAPPGSMCNMPPAPAGPAITKPCTDSA